MDVTVQGVAVKGGGRWAVGQGGRKGMNGEAFDALTESERESLRESERERETDREQQRIHLRETEYRVERDRAVSQETQYPLYSLSKRRPLQ
jgi:hypothetical protein